MSTPNSGVIVATKKNGCVGGEALDFAVKEGIEIFNEVRVVFATIYRV